MRYLSFINCTKIDLFRLVPKCHGWSIEDFGEAKLGDIALLADGLQISNLQHEAFLREMASVLKKGEGK